MAIEGRGSEVTQAFDTAGIERIVADALRVAVRDIVDPTMKARDRQDTVTPLIERSVLKAPADTVTAPPSCDTSNLTVWLSVQLPCRR